MTGPTTGGLTHTPRAAPTPAPARALPRSRRKLAIFLPALLDGGAEFVTLKLAGGMASAGYDVDLVLAKAKGPRLSQVPPGVRAVDLNASRTLTSLPGLTRYLRRERPEVLLSVLDRANLVALVARKLAGVDARVAVSVHSTTSVDARHSRWKTRVMPLFIRALYHQADAILTVSGGSADDLARVAGVARERVRVLTIPVIEPSLFASALEPVDHPWFRPGEPPVVLSAGRLRGQKDFGTLVRAFAVVRQARAARLVILGEGPERGPLEALAAELGVGDDVALPGFTMNPYRYMKRSAVFALSSRWEGMPAVLIEAMANGLPVVSTDCPSGPREVLDGGRHGGLVPVGDHRALAAAIGRALSGEAGPAGDGAWRRYTAEAAVAEHEHVLFPG